MPKVLHPLLSVGVFFFHSRNTGWYITEYQWAGHTNKFRENYTRERSARLTDLIDIKAPIGILYLAETLESSRLSLRHLWDRNGYVVEWFWITMSKLRFLFILGHVIFDDSDTRKESIDHFTVIRDNFYLFTENCSDVIQLVNLLHMMKCWWVSEEDVIYGSICQTNPIS